MHLDAQPAGTPDVTILRPKSEALGRKNYGYDARNKILTKNCFDHQSLSLLLLNISSTIPLRIVCFTAANTNLIS